MKYIKWFNEVGKNDLAMVGGKGANLGELVKAGIPVPDGFIVTAQAYFYFLEKQEITQKIKELLQGLDSEKTKLLNQASIQIKKIISEAEMPEEIKKEIIEAYQKMSVESDLDNQTDLSSQTGEKKLFVAVRSSATAEDLPGASFAGQQATFLNVLGEEEVVKNVQACWASLFESRAIYYRVQKNFDHLKVGIAVPVQKMIQSDISGIMFTIDPVTNDQTKIMIEAGYGLGEAIVSGAVTPDQFLVDKKTLEITNREINKQTWQIKKQDGENKHIQIEEKFQSVQKLSDQEVIELAKLGVKIENYYQFPQDTEWGIEKGKVYLLQSRPVTTISLKHALSEIEGLKVQSSKLEEQKQEKKLILKGIGASIGKASGPVKIIFKPEEIDKVNQGEILVTEMTTPDFVPAMKRAVAIVTDTGGRTCFSGQTLLLTNKGFITIEELKKMFFNKKKQIFFIPSLNLKSLKIEWQKILNVNEKKSKVIKINISQTGRMSENFIELTPDHKFPILNKRKIEHKEIKKILENEDMVLIGEKFPFLNSEKIDFRINQKLAYLLGVISTDGHVHLSRTHGEICFIQKPTLAKKDFIETVQKYWKELFGEYLKVSKKKKSSGFIRGKKVEGEANAYRFYSKKLAQDFKEKLDQLSLMMLFAEEKTILHFLAGVIDGDGTFNTSSSRINIFCSNQNLFKSIIIALLKIGVVPQVTSNRNILNIQIVEKIEDLLKYTHRVKGKSNRMKQDVRFFSARQLFGDLLPFKELNDNGHLGVRIKKNFLIGNKEIKLLLEKIKGKTKNELSNILNSNLRSFRVVLKDKKEKIAKVYNLNVEKNHNFFAFTNRLTPVIVDNCHAAIVSRELGIPCIVGSGQATSILKTGQIITVNGITGEVFEGEIEQKKEMQDLEETQNLASLPFVPQMRIPSQMSVPVTGTKVYLNLAEPEMAEEMAKMPVDGVGLFRAEFMIAGFGEHPKKMIKEGRSEEFVEKMADGMRKFVENFYPRPVVYRANDFKTNEYRGLKGGEEFEKEEENPMIGFRGASRYLKDREIFDLEIKAIKKVRDEIGFKNLWLMIPFVRTIDEFLEIRKILEESGLKQSHDFKLWIMVEVPATVFLIEEFCKQRIDGVSVGSNDLTQLILGIDRDNSILQNEFDERNEAVLKAIQHVIRVCKKYGVSSSICGQAPSVYPEVTEFLVKEGVTSVSVSPDVVFETRRLIASCERKIIMEKLRKL